MLRGMVSALKLANQRLATSISSSLLLPPLLLLDFAANRRIEVLNEKLETRGMTRFERCRIIERNIVV
jgi:hypothetical protein